MTNTQKFQLVKSNRDAVVDAATLAGCAVVIYLIMRPDAYDRITEAVNGRMNQVSHWLSVWQTRLSIRSLPETDE